MNRTKAVLPAIAALVSLVVMAGAGGFSKTVSGYVVDTAPTRYSADHAVAQLRGTEDLHAPTF